VRFFSARQPLWRIPAWVVSLRYMLSALMKPRAPPRHLQGALVYLRSYSNMSAIYKLLVPSFYRRAAGELLA